jgi:hypothetical protein
MFFKRDESKFEQVQAEEIKHFMDCRKFMLSSLTMEKVANNLSKLSIEESEELKKEADMYITDAKGMVCK